MNEIINYVKPELIVVAVVLYMIGTSLKNAKSIKDKYIPFILGGAGIVICAAYIIATSEYKTVQEISMMIFTSITQGILVAGLSTYVNQLIKQGQKQE